MTDFGELDTVIKREITRYIADHEVLLSFSDDQHAFVFGDWMFEHGWELFKKYYAGHPDVTG